MGYAVAAAAARAGHEVTLLSGPVFLDPPARCRVVPFVSVAELKAALQKHFPWCEALVMAAAVGDFRPEAISESKLHRSDGPIAIRLVPTDDVVGGLAKDKREDQVVIVFAVEDGTYEEIQARARAKLIAKGADFVVANRPAAMAVEQSEACILSTDGVILPWAWRGKDELAERIVGLLECGQ